MTALWICRILRITGLRTAPRPDTTRRPQRPKSGAMYSKNFRKMLRDSLIQKIGPQKIQWLQIFLLIGDDTCKIMVGCTYPSFHFLHGAGTLKLTVDCLTSTCPSIRTKTCTRVLDSMVRTAKEKGAVGTSTRADACAFTSDPQPRVFQILTTLTFRALRKNHQHSRTSKNNETSSSICGQQCIVKCQEHNRCKKGTSHEKISKKIKIRGP